MSNRDVMQQALEALKSAAIFVDSFRGQKATQEAITALREALEQPEPDLIPQDKLFVCGQMGANITRVTAQPKQEPVDGTREGFEKWAKSLPNYIDISRFENSYSDCNADYAWAGWQAALAQPEQQAEPVAWDVFELRLYGAPQEKQHRVLWVDRYAYPDGSTPDLDTLLEAAKTEGGIDGRAKTLHVRPLYTTPPAAQRPWVGLTETEIDYQAKKDDHGVYFALGALWAEAKLKEINT